MRLTLFKLGIIFFMIFSQKVMALNVKTCIDSLLDANYQADAPGCALLITKGNKIIYDSGRGIADVKTNQAIDGNTVFNIASITKQFTVAGILKLQELGRLSIEDSVSKFIPEFNADFWHRVKLKHLMSHCSGIPDKRNRKNQNYMLYITDAQCLDYMKDLTQLKFEPGAYYDYINPTFQILAEIIQRISGMDFEDFQQKNIFEPSMMNNVRYFSPEKQIPNMAHGYIAENNTLRIQDNDSHKNRDLMQISYTDSSGINWAEYDYGEETFFGTKADGGIYTSTHDLLNWENALTVNSCLGSRSKELAYTPHIKVSGSPYCAYQNRPDSWYGYGWFIDTSIQGLNKIYHTGDNGGFQSYVAKYPDNDVHVIMLENRNDIDRWKLQLKIEQILIRYQILRINSK